MKYNSTDSLLQYISNLTGLRDFYVIGSVAYNHLINGHTVLPGTCDVDIVIVEDYLYFDRLCFELHSRGFSNIRHSFYFAGNNPIYNIVACKDGLSVDIAIAKSIEEVRGHFSIESVYLKFPEYLVVDEHNAVEKLKKDNHIFPVVDLEQHNPMIVYGRLIKLCAKFNLNLDGETLVILRRLSERIMGNNGSESYFNGHYAHGFLLRRVLKSYFLSNNDAFKKDLLIHLKQGDLIKMLFFGLDLEVCGTLGIVKGSNIKYRDFVCALDSQITEEEKRVSFPKILLFLEKHMDDPLV